MGKCSMEVITIQQSKCSISQLVLFQFYLFHWYLYPLLIICFCRVLFLALPKESETNRQKLPIALMDIVIYYTLFITIGVIVGFSGFSFRKVNALYFKFDCYGYINLTKSYTYDLSFVFPCLNLFTAQKIRNKTVEAPFFYLMRAPTIRYILGSSWSLKSNNFFLLGYYRYSSD